MVSLIMGCSLIGTVLLIGLCTPLSAAINPPDPLRANTSAIVIEESARDDWHFNNNCEDSVGSKSIGGDPVKTDLREWIASSSIPILRARGMTDEEIKAELLRDFNLTEEQVDAMLVAQ